MCLQLAFPFSLSYIVSTVCTPLLCHNKQLLCSFNFKSSCSSRFELEKKRSLEVLGELGRQSVEPQVLCSDHLSPHFSPSNLTGFSLASPGELCILNVHL